ncbi:MAG: DUF86 domain-containing protein [Phycisphaera sp.]|nr:DUF86 domain-containing protein [Phycisphaera sp.]
MPHDRDSMQDIPISARLAVGYLSNISQEQFLHDTRCQDAVVRRIEVMGEAAKRVSAETQKRYPDLPWREMASMRNRVIHGYDTIDLEVVWDSVRRDLPALIQRLESILSHID